MQKILITIIVLSFSLGCLAKEDLEYQKLKLRQIETPIFFADKKNKINLDEKIETSPKIRTKYNHQESINIFNYDVALKNNLSGEVQKELTTTFKPFSFPQEKGQVILGSAYFNSENKYKNIENNTYEVFSKYELGRFSFQTELERTRNRHYENASDYVYLTPRVELTKNLALRVEHNKRVESQNYKNDFILEYSLKNNPILNIDNINIELNASYINNSSDIPQRQIGAKTKYYF